jgi:ATP adenylyltransferase
MDYLWTPWRYQYLTKPGEPEGCIFCAAGAASDDEAYLVVHRGQYNFVILNRYPYTSGHVMVVPYQHAAMLEALPDETLVELIRMCRDSEKHLKAIYRPEGLNIGINIGRAAGAGIAGHLHVHALPRWTGDSNFMTTVGETRVVPEELDVTWQRLRSAFQGGQ